MTTHDFRPGDVVEYGGGVHVVKALGAGVATILHEPSGTVVHVDPANLLLRRRPEHTSRSRAASSLRAASASLTTAIDHLARAGEAETYPGQSNTRTRTAAEETQACIHHATMALYWLLHERLGS